MTVPQNLATRGSRATGALAMAIVMIAVGCVDPDLTSVDVYPRRWRLRCPSHHVGAR